MRVDIPPRWTPKFGTEDERIEAKAFEFTRSVRIEGGEAVLRYDLDVRERDVAVADTGHHLENLRLARDGLGASLRFDIPRSKDADARAKRLQELLRGVRSSDASPSNASTARETDHEP